jgi:Protein of unknown function (DUF3153)
MKKFLPFLLGIIVFLSGCVRYDVGINFSDQHHGAIVQHITLAEQLTSLSQTDAEKWLSSIQKRAKQLQGNTKKISDREIIVTIPFSNGHDLVNKFNRFFNADNNKKYQAIKLENNQELLQLEGKISVFQSNALLFERNKINLNIDLRALGLISNQGNILISPGDLVNLEFSLNTPGNSKIISQNLDNNLTITQGKNDLIWKLKPGQINQIELVFWVPSWLGIGTVGIILLMISGFYLKYKQFPGLSQLSRI